MYDTVVQIEVFSNKHINTYFQKLRLKMDKK